MPFEKEVTETLRQFITGMDAYILTGLTITLWGLVYAVISLTTGYPWIAVLIGLVIAILGMYSLFSIFIDYIEYRFEHRFNLTFTKFTRYLYRSLLFILLCALILLSVYGIIPYFIILEPLDFITNYLFYILIIPLISNDVFGILATKEYDHFGELKLDAHAGRKLNYIILTMFAAIIYAGFALFFAATGQSPDIVLTFLPIPILVIIIYVMILKKKVNIQENIVSNVNFFKLLSHIGALIVIVIFLYRAWLIYTRKEHADIFDVTASLAIITAGILFSAYRLSKMEFATPKTVSKYIFGLAAFGIGGVVIAVLYTRATGIGMFTIDTAMMLLYAAYVIGISMALIASIISAVFRPVSQSSTPWENR